MEEDDRREQPDSLAGRPGAGERRPGLRAAGIIATRIAAPILLRRGGILARLKAGWCAAVGTELAAIAWPESLGRDGALKLLVAPGFALDLQHRAPLMIERINLHLGRTAVTRLILVQGTLPLAAPPARPAPELGVAEARSLEARLSDIADPELREALGGLGRLLWARSSGSDPPFSGA